MTTDLFQRVASLTPQQRNALAQRLTDSSRLPATQRLVAYIALQPNDQETHSSTDPSAIRAALKQQLPAHMVPAVVVSLLSLPRTTNGKIDTKALPAPALTLLSNNEEASAKVAPKTPVEKSLLNIWQRVLKLKTIGIHDNFFDLGGDSILSIQIVSQAREKGLRIAPNQLFEQSTIAELAAVVNITPEVQAMQSAVSGPVPLTPIQHWFFSQNMACPEHWHQALLLELPHTVSLGQVKETLKTLWHHHDALRLRFTPLEKTSVEEKDFGRKNDLKNDAVASQQADWQQYNAAVDSAPVLRQVDLGELGSTSRYDVVWKKMIAFHATCLHTSTALTKGNLFQTAHFTLSPAQPSWLLISLHHLAVDGISWQILQNDLQTLLSSSSPTQRTHLSAKTTAFKTWAETLASQAASRVAELPFWLSQLQTSTRLPQDFSSPTVATERTASTHSVTLSATETSALLQTVPAAYNTQINDAFITGLTKTLEEWIGADGSTAQSIVIDLESHGRNQAAPDVDLSRTVGWFTAVYPVRLQLDPTAADSTTSIAARLKAVKEQLRQIPDKGIGYGILRYLSSPNIQQQLAQLPSPDLLFNYLGQRDDGEPALSVTQSENAVRILKGIDLGALRNPDNSRGYALEINAWVADGQLQMNWTYDTKRYRPDTIESIAKNYLSTLREIITHCVAIEQGGFTPSDFPDVHFTQAQLDDFIAGRSLNNIEAIYPLSPTQQSFLWHSLQSSVQAGLLHMRGTLVGELQAPLLQQAWQIVVNRHTALRCSVHWDNLDQPVQVVTQSPSIPWQQLDYRTQPDARQAIAAFLESDRAIGFNFTQAPIIRLTLIQLADQTHELIWTCHHLMLDGWSGTLVFNQVLQTYEALKQKQQPALAPAPSYQTYIHWLRQQDLSIARRFWQQTLRGFTTPTPLPPWFSAGASTFQWIGLTETQTVQLNTYLRTHRLTLNTLIQGTWALLLSLISGQSDVVFGATISGRQAELANIDSMVGLLTNVLPVRAILSPSIAVLTWLQTLQTEQAAASRYAYASTAQIQSWSELPGRLFNSLLVIENYPASPAKSASDLTLHNLQSGIISTYDLTLIVKPGKQITIYAQALAAQSEHTTALLSDFAQLLNDIVASPDLSIAQLCSKADTLHSHKQQPIERSSSSVSQPSTAALPDAVSALPSSPLELELTRIWEAVLGKSALNTQANFFELGGDSLSAVQLFNQIQQQLDHTLPLASLFQAPTIRQLAALLSSDKPAMSWSSLVPINPQGDRPPLFFHGGSADALTWARFSHLLGQDQPFYALQRPDLDGSLIKEMTVEALATACINEMRTVQPEGPYIVGGHCFGGAVAFEIARQLQAEGEAIASLIQIDAYCPNAQPHTLLGQLQEQLQLSYFLLRKSYYYHGNPKKIIQLPRKIWQKLKPSPPKPRPSSTTATPSHLSTTTSHLPTTTSQTTHLPYEQRYAQAHQANIRAANRYHSHKSVSAASMAKASYTGPIHIFCASTQILSWRYGPTLGWETTTSGPITTTTVPGIFGNLFNQDSGPLLVHQLNTHLKTLS